MGESPRLPDPQEDEDEEDSIPLARLKEIWQMEMENDLGRDIGTWEVISSDDDGAIVTGHSISHKDKLEVHQTADVCSSTARANVTEAMQSEETDQSPVYYADDSEDQRIAAFEEIAAASDSSEHDMNMDLGENTQQSLITQTDRTYWGAPNALCKWKMCRVKSSTRITTFFEIFMSLQCNGVIIMIIQRNRIMQWKTIDCCNATRSALLNQWKRIVSSNAAFQPRHSVYQRHHFHRFHHYTHCTPRHK